VEGLGKKKKVFQLGEKKGAVPAGFAEIPEERTAGTSRKEKEENPPFSPPKKKNTQVGKNSTIGGKEGKESRDCFWNRSPSSFRGDPF